ncbi:MAG: GTPase [Candidatus Nanoarchaeia archaeon]
MYSIPKVFSGKYYASMCIQSMEEYALKERKNIDKRWDSSTQAKKNQEGKEIILNKRKDLEMQKIRHINKKAFEVLQKITKRFPKPQTMPPIYQELLNTSTTSFKEYESALKHIRSIQNGIDMLCSQYLRKIQYSKGHDALKFQFKKFMGKFNSYFTKEEQTFQTLQDTSHFLSKLPTFKDIFTTAIAGFPNVGKSTLMKNVTKSNVEIQNYPFTTKGLLFGYLYHNEVPLIQFIDTPGLLGRTKSNAIEQRAQIIIQNYANQLVFVIDLTTSCGYTINEQIKLLKETIKLEKPIIIYFSKTDLYEEDEDEEFERVSKQFKKIPQYTNYEELKAYVLEKQKEEQKLNVKSIRHIKM